MDQLSIGEARRIALAAQGFTEKRPSGKVGRRQLQKVVDRLQVVQLDSVNVAVRSHYMPFFSRLGPYPLAELDALAWATHHLFEYWGHQASLLPVEQHPLHRWKMAQRRHDRQSRWLNELEKKHPGYIDAVLEEVRERGPLAAGELTDPGKKTGPWWGYSKGKQTLEYLFWTGQVTANRRASFERVYDVPERAIPADVLAAPTPGEQDARKALLEISARALAVGTVGDLTNYFMLNTPKCRSAIDELVEEGVLVAVQVEGWTKPAYRHRDAKLPRRVDATALLSPFDNLVWYRDPRRAAVRLPLPHRDLYTGAEADLRVLRAAVPPWRHHRRPSRRQSRPEGKDASGAGRVRGTRCRCCGGRGGTGWRASRNGRLVGARTSRNRPQG